MANDPKDYPQKFVRVTFNLSVEWTDGGPNGDPEYEQEVFAQIEKLTGKDLVLEAVANLDTGINLDINDFNKSVQIQKGMYSADGRTVMAQAYTINLED